MHFYDKSLWYIHTVLQRDNYYFSSILYSYHILSLLDTVILIFDIVVIDFLIRSFNDHC